MKSATELYAQTEPLAPKLATRCCQSSTPAVVTNTISEQPRFLAPERFDYRLHPTSPGWDLDGVKNPIGWRGFGAE